MALYEELQHANILGPLMRYFEAKQLQLKLDDDGTPYIPLHRSVETRAPWINHRWFFQRQCDLWTIYFNVYKIIPRGCRACWKVVMKINNLEQLFSVNKKQKDFGSNCKCGIETRAYTGGLGGYRAYFYGRLDKGLEYGLELFRRVRRTFPGINIYLKRGCTEFENWYPPSDKWDELAQERQWNFKEDLANALFRPDSLPEEHKPPTALEILTMIRWIEFAFEHGDQTYKNFVEGNMIPEPFKYENSILKDSDLPDSIFRGTEDGLNNNRLEAVEPKGSSLSKADGNQKSGVAEGEKGSGEKPSLTIIS